MTKAAIARERDEVTYIAVGELFHDFEAPEASGIRPVRSGVPNGDDLIESLRKHGQIVPVVFEVYDKKRYVIAGNRRLAAFRKLYAPTMQVMALDSEYMEGDAAEIAVADNVIRSPLHPVDKFEAFAALVADGRTTIDIATAFSIREREVEQSLAVAKLAPEVRAAWRSGAISADAATSFTLEPDKKRQASILAKLSKGGADVSDWQVRREVGGGDAQSNRLLRFVGVDAYEKAGGRVSVDLFQENHAVSDFALLEDVAEKKLAEVCRGLVEQHGWKFAISADKAQVRYSWKRDRLEPVYAKGDKAKLKELDKLINEDNDADITAWEDARDQIESAAKMRAWNDIALRAKVGCVIEIDHEGNLDVEPGYHMPSKAKADVAAASDPVNAPTEADKKKADKERAKKAEAGIVSKVLEKALTEQFRAATEAALIATAKSWEESLVGMSLASYLAALVADLVKPTNHFSRVLGDDCLAAVRNGIVPELMRDAIAETFDAKGYFASIPKANLLAVVRQAVGDSEAERLAKKPVGEIESYCLQAVPSTGWLPMQLRTPSYDGPGQATAEPKKKATKKKAAKR